MLSNCNKKHGKMKVAQAGSKSNVSNEHVYSSVNPKGFALYFYTKR